MRHAWWRLYLLVLLSAAAGYAIMPPGTPREWLAMVAGATAPVAIVVGLLGNRPGRRGPWYVLCTAEVALLASKIAVRVQPPDSTSGGPPLHGQLFVLSYLLMAAGLTMVARPVVRRDPAILIDALVVTVGAGVTTWVFLMAPTTADQSLTVATKATLIACPMLDIALLTVAVPVVLSGRSRPMALRLLLGWLAGQLVVDAATTTMVLNGGEPLSTPVTGGWLAGVAFLGAAALHPSAATRVDADGGVDHSRLNLRMPVLVTAGLGAPIVLAVDSMRNGHGEMAVIATATTATVVLVLTRIGWLVRLIALAQSRLTASEAMLTESQRVAQVGSWSWDLPTGVMTWSPQFYELLGLDRQVPATFERFIESVHPEDRMTRVDRVQQALDGWRPTRERYRVVRADGEVRVVHSEVAPIDDASGRPTRIVGTAQDVTDLDLAARQVEELAAIVRFSHDAVLRIDPDGLVTRWNAGAERLFGYTADEVTGRSAAMLLPPAVLDDPDSWHLSIDAVLATAGQPIEGMETVILCKDGRTVPVAVTASPIRDVEGSGRYTGAAVIIRDVTQRKQLEEQLTRQALHDPLTGLANRGLLLHRLEQAIVGSRQPAGTVALFFIDLDDFKLVNDMLGHHAGDQLLVAVADRLRACARTGDTVARLGGDEFAVVLESISEEDARQFADRLTAALQPAVDLDGTLVSARASVGIALHAWDSPDDPGTLLRKADLAMYAAKRQDKGGYQVFADEIQSEFTARVELEAELRRAVAEDEFHLHYQPIVALSNGEITGFEALLRWNRQQRSPLGPDRFIPVLESSGLITQVGEWVLNEACRQAALWQAETGRAISVSVNVSPPQLNAANFVDLVIATLRRTKLPPATLTLEITEGVMVADVEQVITKLHQLRDLGIRMAIDDFGTGYSSLRYLQTLPVDTVKIDRSFIAKIQEGREQTALARAIVGVGHALNLAVVAEGVETSEHVRLLRGIGCEYGQGYHFARPQDPATISATLLGDHPARTRPS